MVSSDNPRLPTCSPVTSYRRHQHWFGNEATVSIWRSCCAPFSKVRSPTPPTSSPPSHSSSLHALFMLRVRGHYYHFHIGCSLLASSAPPRNMALGFSPVGERASTAPLHSPSPPSLPLFPSFSLVSLLPRPNTLLSRRWLCPGLGGWLVRLRPHMPESLRMTTQQGKVVRCKRQHMRNQPRLFPFWFFQSPLSAGAGFNAYVVVGYAKRDVALGSRLHDHCPLAGDLTKVRGGRPRAVEIRA